MRKHIIALVLIGLSSNAATAASEGEIQASSFANIYASLFLKHLNNLEALREMSKNKWQPTVQYKPWLMNGQFQMRQAKCYLR